RAAKINLTSVTTRPPVMRPPYAKLGPTTIVGPTKIANERFQYQIMNRTEETARVQKTHRLTTEEIIDGRPPMDLSGQGEFVFDMVAGLCQSSKMTYTLSVTPAPGQTATATTIVTYRLLTGDVAKKHFDDVSAAEAKAKADAAAAAHYNADRPFDPGER